MTFQLDSGAETMKKWRVFSLLILLCYGIPAIAQPSEEFRAFWIDGFNAGFRTTQEVDTMLQRVRSANMNAIVVQMRKRGDAHYKSNFEPPASNQDPNFDALAYLIDRAHNGTPRIEVHVWFNMHPVHPGSGWPSDPRHIMNRFPEVLTQDNTGNRVTDVGYAADLGHPVANDFTFRVIMDVLRRYDIDGIHFDYIRYTGTSWGYNPVNVARFNARYGRTGTPSTSDADWKQWRRDQVTAMVRKVYTQTLAIKPHVKVSGALITWGNGPTSDSAWLNSSAYSAVFQDWRGWLQEGILDMGIPMCYYNHNVYPNYYQNWINFIKDRQYGRHSMIGIGNYLNTLQNTFTQMDLARAATTGGNRAKGITMFSYAATRNEGNGTVYHDPAFYSALTQKYTTWVPSPAMPWKTNPTKGAIKGTILRASDLSWVDSALVTIIRNGLPVKTMYADGTGYYGAVELDPGVYSITMSAPGLSTVRTDSVIVTAGLTTTVNVLMGNTDAIPIRDIGSARTLPAGTNILLQDKVITAGTNEFASRLYMQDLLRASGIAVNVQNPSLPWLPGDMVAVKGTLTYDSNGELLIDNAQVQLLGVTMPPRPLATSIRDIWGGR